MSEGYALPQYKPMSGNDRQILERGNFTGVIRGYERYGLFFADSIGYRISPDGSDTPLFYGEVKIDAKGKYHAIPRTSPSQD